MRMNFRTDSSIYAELAGQQEKARELYADNPNILAEIERTPPAAPGDTWRMLWAGEGDALAGEEEGSTNVYRLIL
jgi:hypothetical protein